MFFRPRSRSFAFASALLILSIAPLVRAAEPKATGTDLDSYKWRVSGDWWFDNPSGYVQGKSDNVPVDFQKDLNFGSFSTFTGKIDWHFKRKHHFTLAITPTTLSHSTTLTRTITYQGVTYTVGTRISTDFRLLSFAPAYQYDFVRRDHGYLAGAAQFNMIDTKASITGLATVNESTAIRTASGSVFAPLPLIGVQTRWYPMHDSSRVNFDGNILGMYLFGYGDVISTRGTVGVALNRHLNLRAGYQLGSRLSVHGSSSETKVRSTQKGPTVGIEGSW